MAHNLGKTEKDARRPDARVLKSRAALRDALLALVAEHPFAEINIAMLADKAGVGYATFFRHYPDKEALLADVADAMIADLLARLLPLLLDGDGRTAMRGLAAYVDEHRPICRALLFGAGEAIRAEITRRAIDRTRAAQTPTPSWLPRELAIVHGVGATLNIIGWWLQNGDEMSTDALAAALERLVIAPILPETDRA
ncbi:MAG TPA: TetR/AcrR family transcriptional regulator [Allosphingosinicella sp.]|nr:TetR/AcrR family transcriptional regulator [Allosphingosinicella sp.]